MRILRFLPVFCFALFAGCARDTPTSSTPPAPVETTAQTFPKDDLGREVNLKSPAQRVVCIGPGATETIFALDAGAQLVGRDQVSDYPAAALKVPIVGDYTGPFIEKVIAAKPDLVIVQGETYDRARAEIWQQRIGAPVAILVPTSVRKFEQDVVKTSAWLGLKKSFKVSIYPRTGHRVGVPAFFEVGRSPLWTAGSGTLINDVMHIAGLDNVARVNGYKQFNIEKLLALQPYVYIVPVAAETPPKEYPRLLSELKKDRVLGRLKCVQENRVIFINSDWILRAGPRLQQGLQKLAERGDQLSLQLDSSQAIKRN